jgi:hypothetical protein
MFLRTAAIFEFEVLLVTPQYDALFVRRKFRDDKAFMKSLIIELPIF